MASLTMFETSQLIAKELQISPLGYMELMEHNQNDLCSTLNCNFKAFNHNTLPHAPYYKPRSYKNVLMAKQCILKQISFIIASYIISPNSSFQNKIIKCLSDTAIIDRLSVPYTIIQIIVQRFLCGIRWDIQFNNKSFISFIKEQEEEQEENKNNDDTDSSDSEQDEYLKYDLNECLIKYPMEIIDALHIATTFQINLSEYVDRNYQYIFHINMVKKGDESWIGLMDKTAFKSLCEYQSKLNENVCILYYGGRERSIDTRLSINGDILKHILFNNNNSHNLHDSEIEHALMTYLNPDGHGAIYQNGQSVMDKLKPFRTTDWISICIENNIITFYNNGQLIYYKDLTENKLYNKDLILFSLVDYHNDSIFIEQSFSKNGLNV